MSEFNAVYRGATVGLGIEINSSHIYWEGNFWDIGLLVPFRSSAFKNDQEVVKNHPNITDFQGAWPVLIVVGYNFNLKRKEMEHFIDGSEPICLQPVIALTFKGVERSDGAAPRRSLYHRLNRFTNRQIHGSPTRYDVRAIANK